MLITNLSNGDVTKTPRVFYSHCRYRSTTCSDEYDCVGLGTIRCTSRDAVAWMRRVGTNQIEQFDERRLFEFYAVPEVSLDREDLLRAAWQHWDMEQMLYKSERYHLITSDQPSDTAFPKSPPTNVLNRLKIGPYAQATHLGSGNYN